MKSRHISDHIQCFIDIMPMNYTISYNTQSFPHPAVSCGISVGEKVFVSGWDCGISHVYGQTGLWQYSDSNQDAITEQYQ